MSNSSSDREATIGGCVERALSPRRHPNCTAKYRRKKNFITRKAMYRQETGSAVGKSFGRSACYSAVRAAIIGGANVKIDTGQPAKRRALPTCGPCENYPNKRYDRKLLAKKIKYLFSDITLPTFFKMTNRFFLVKVSFSPLFIQRSERTARQFVDGVRDWHGRLKKQKNI